MKYILFILPVILLLGGCTKVEDLTKNECIEKGHKWKSEMKMNWLSGKEEDRGKCEKRK